MQETSLTGVSTCTEEAGMMGTTQATGCPLRANKLALPQGVSTQGTFLFVLTTPAVAAAAAAAKSLQSCPTLCDPRDGSPPGSPVAGALIKPCLGEKKNCNDFPPHTKQKPISLQWLQFSSVAQSYPTLRYPMDYSTPGLPVYHKLLELIRYN